MKKERLTCLLVLVLACLLLGCTKKPDAQPQVPVETTVEATVPATVPADGNPEDVTCRGSYTREGNAETSVASVGEARLTNGQLGVWYWAAVSQYRQENHPEAPDFSKPLDSQRCTVDDSVNSWQQYFLARALDAWHISQALAAQAAETPLTWEAAYKPNPTTHARCMTGMPVTRFLYGYNEVYETNTMHQAYLDQIPQLLADMAGALGYGDAETMAARVFGCTEAELTEAVRQYNYAYMYQTFLNYDLQITQEEAEEYYRENAASYPEQGTRVDIRHILLIPAEGETVQTTQEEADRLLREWRNKNKATEAAFADMAYRHSMDPGTAMNGGGYYGVAPGQLPAQLEQWCFAGERKTGDTAVITTEYGVHILYFAGSKPAWFEPVCKDLAAGHVLLQTREAKVRFPREVRYADIALSQGEAAVSYSDFLYPDIAHERYPEVPLYLQQDYLGTMYGSHRIVSHGCGITTFSMLTTYMTDQEWTPPEMCDLFGGYSHSNGTDGMLFIREPARFGYFMRQRSYDPKEVHAALEEGCLVVSIQHKGYWTSGGHYILFEKLTEDGMVQVRDSNIANYQKLSAHAQDKHTWGNATNSSGGYWIFEPKVTRCSACLRCGSDEELSFRLLSGEYYCPRCDAATTRREAYLSAPGA